MKCTACLQGFDWECAQHGNCEGTMDPTQIPVPVQLDTFTSGGENEDSDDDGIVINQQDDSKLKDQQSTGRKRAAKMYPLNSEAPCDWSGKRNCGGGNYPIVGCRFGKQQARHHGPDKNTLNNERSNVHRICHNCHNRWHTQNDVGYVWGAIYNAHSPVVASESDLVKNEDYWATRTTQKAID